MDLLPIGSWEDKQALFILSALFLLVFTGAFSVIYRWLDSRQPKPTEPVKLPLDDLSTRHDLLLGKWTPALAAQVPVGSAKGEAIQKELLAAGYYRQVALMEYAAVRTVLIVAPLVMTGMLALLADNEQLPSILLWGGLACVLGYSLPRVYVALRGRARMRSIEAGLPIAVDMLTLCLSAGQNLLAAFRRVAQEMRHCHRTLSEELEIVHLQAELRSLPHALQQFANRVPAPEVRNMAMIVIQAERLGTDICSALIEYGNSLRTSARQKADTRANKTMFWMLFPTLLCLWIPAAIILIAPAVLEFQEHRKNALQQWRESRKELRSLTAAPAAALPLEAPQP